MNQYENTEKGTLEMVMSYNERDNLCFGRMRYDENKKIFVTDSILSIYDFVCCDKKTHALQIAKRIKFPANHVEKIGSRWCRGWGIRHDFNDTYFLVVSTGLIPHICNGCPTCDV